MNKHVRIEGSVFVYATQPADEKAGKIEISASVDLEPIVGFSALTQTAKDIIVFGMAHVCRNATAGKMEKPDEALKPILTRFKALEAGKFRAHREGGEEGESEYSLLARALAVVMGVEPSESAAFIVEQVNAELEANGIDPEIEFSERSKEDQAKSRKLAAASRKSISNDAAVALELERVRLAERQASLAEAEKAAAAATSRFAKKAA